MSTELQIAIRHAPKPGSEPAGIAPPDLPAVPMVWRVNLRLLAFSLVAGGVLGPLLFLWHQFQVGRHAAGILQRACLLQAEEDWNGAAAAFHRYLQLEPEDAQALLLRAQAYDKLAVVPGQRPRTVSLYFQALPANPERHDVRLRLAELLFESRRFDEAADQARRVQAALPDDVKAARLLAVSLREQLGPAKLVTLAEVIEAYQFALAVHKGDIPLSIGLAEILRTKHDVLPGKYRRTAIATADEIMNLMIAIHPRDPEALLARFRYRGTYKIAGADEDLETARQIAPDDPDVLFASAASAAETDRDAVRKYGRRLLEVAPQKRRSYLDMAALFRHLKDTEAALQTLQAGLKTIGENDLDLNRGLLELYLSLGKADEARAALARVEPAARVTSPYLPAPLRSRIGEEIEVARARLQLFDGQTALALPTLKRMAVNVSEGSDPDETLAERLRRWRLLADVYSRLGLFDLAGTAYDELVRLDPASPEHELLAGAAWRISGDVERAIRHFEAVTLSKSEISAAWIGLAEARLDYQIRKVPGEARDWRTVDLTVKQARLRLGDVPVVVILQATAEIARNHRRAALAELKKLVDDKDLDAAFLPRLAGLLQDVGESNAADNMLDRYRDSGGDPAVVAFTKSELLRRRGEAAAGLAVLETALEQVPESGRNSLRRHLVAVEIDAGAIQSARRRLRELRKAGSEYFWVYETAADLAIMAGDFDDVQECEGQLLALEGPTGSLWRYFRAVRLLETEKDTREAVRKVNQLLGEIQAKRPNWPLTHLLEGRLAERSGRIAQAADLYEIALRSGARHLTTFQWLVSTLYRQNRFADAAAYIRQGGQIAMLSSELSPQTVPANLRAGQVEDALRIARAAAELRPADPLAQVWYGQTLSLADRGAKAEEVLQNSIRLAPKDVRTRSALVWFYGRQHRTAEARQALDELVAEVELTPFERALVLARGCDLIGDRPLAEGHYRDALAIRQKNTRLLEEIGRFYLRFDHDKAFEMFQRVIAIDPQSKAARRVMAVLLGNRGTDADWARAIALLEEGDKSTAIDDRRLKATLLLSRGTAEDVQAAGDLMREVIDSQENPLASDRLTLIRIHEDAKQIDEARAQFESLLKEHDTAEYLALYVDFLNRNNLLAEAGRGLARLELKDPADSRILELRVDRLARLGRSGEIEETVDQALAPRLTAARKGHQKAALLRSAADLLTWMKLPDAAEKKLREAAALDPGGYEFLALWLARRERIEEALDLCREQLSGGDRTRAATVMVRVLTVAAARSETPPAAAPAVDEVISAALGPQRDNLPLLLEVGVLRAMQGRDSEAVALYEETLARSPDHSVVLNNLAVLLADIPERAAEGLRYIDRAIAAAPSSPDLLDSRALVLIGVGRPADARDILERLCRSDRKNTRYRMHLAFALYHLNETDLSHDQIQKALQDGLEREMLTPSERRLLHKITSNVAAATP